MKEYKEEDFLMISGIQHFSFCRRQWALIHVEQLWAENVRTYEGQLLHERAHDTELTEKRNGTIISRGIPIKSEIMGASGCCDVVEFHQVEKGISLFGYNGQYEVYPIEYKRGSPKTNEADILQLVAQVMCLEEMLSCKIDKGALYYGEIRRRVEVEITPELRNKVTETFSEMHRYFDALYTPKVKWSKGCNACSLKDLCMPQMGKRESAKKYVSEYILDEV